MVIKRIDYIFSFFFSDRRKFQVEKTIFAVAIVAFIVHFTLISLAEFGLFPQQIYSSDIALNPITSVYTPFSIILLYEVYLLIYYLPKSITIYLGKQYEIVALILIRGLFETLGRLPVKDGVLVFEDIQYLLISFAGLLILFLLIYLYYKLGGNKENRVCLSESRRRFITTKKVLALGLMVLFFYLFVRSLVELRDISLNIKDIVDALKTINNTFFHSFFTALILVEVLLLLFTFNLSDQFSKVIRNSGFIISTILLKLSFMVSGVISLGLILIAVAFGVAILGIHKLFEQKLQY